MNVSELKTLGDLKKINYQSKSIKREMRENLIRLTRSGKELFEGIKGYEHSVIPQLKQAILAEHNINFLGLRGQAKTRMAWQMIELLDEYIPFVSGSEINDDPFRPISDFAKNRINELGDQTPIDWLHRSERFFEKLATPDVSVADLIGDVDPIKAANLKLALSDPEVIHYGMVPRANRCLFVINELPDLQARIQVSLFSILQEGEVQIRGFKLKLPLDVTFVFTANPEDYTNRGSIVTPLKDRIGSQIVTHYPKDMETAKAITSQEAKWNSTINISIPEPARDIIESIGFQARKSEYVDAKSGVSARLSISAFEHMMSHAELRLIENGEQTGTIRVSDILAVVPAITGKVELVYEGENEGPVFVAEHLIEYAIKQIFEDYFPKIEKLEKKGVETPYDNLYTWFYENDALELHDNSDETYYHQCLDQIKPLEMLLNKYAPEIEGNLKYFFKELVIFGLVASKKLTKGRVQNTTMINDLYSSYFS